LAAYSLIFMNCKVNFSAISILLVLMVAELNAQTGGKPSPAGKAAPQTNKLHERVYLKSKGVGDLASATMSLYYWMEAQPGRKDLMDSLCFIYLGRGMFGQSAAVAKEILKDQKENLPVKEALAQSYEGLGAYPEAIAVYQQLFSSVKRPLFLYKVAALQYLSKNFSASEQNLDALESLAGVEKERIVLNYQGERLSSQAVPVLAATKNIRGILLMESGKKQEAEAMFNSALEVFPGFIMAERNLQTLQK
jgi:tetratricopeptide (TPR) repeat protein